MTDKDLFIEKMHAKIDEWNAQIDRLTAKSRVAKAEVKEDYQARISKLQHQRDEFRQKIEKAGSVSSSAWQDLKSGLKLAMEAMETSLKSARDRFK